VIQEEPLLQRQPGFELGRKRVDQVILPQRLRDLAGVAIDRRAQEYRRRGIRVVVDPMARPQDCAKVGDHDIAVLLRKFAADGQGSRSVGDPQGPVGIAVQVLDDLEQPGSFEQLCLTDRIVIECVDSTVEQRSCLMRGCSMRPRRGRRRR